MLILYASETGTCEQVAFSFRRTALRLNVKCNTLSMHNYDIKDLLHEYVVLFVVSTTGQGDNPISMQKFWKHLMMKKLPKTCLENLHFAVLALGDSSYRKYNYCGKKLNNRLLQLGAKKILDIGLADDQHELGAYAVIDVWFHDFWLKSADYLNYSQTTYNSLDKVFISLPCYTQIPVRLPSNESQCFSTSTDATTTADIATTTPATTSSPSTDATTTSPSIAHTTTTAVITTNTPSTNAHTTTADITTTTPSTTSSIPPPSPYTHQLHLVSNVRVTPLQHWQAVHNLEFKSDQILDYKCGDTVMFYPRNSRENVQTFLDLFHIEQDEQFSLSCNYEDTPLPPDLPRVLTWRILAQRYLDINSIPKKYFWIILHNLMQPREGEEEDAELEREKLSEFITPEGQDELFMYCNRPRRNVLEVLSDFPIALSRLSERKDLLFDVVTSLQPRQMSIASSSKVNIGLVQVLVAVVDYYTILKKPRLGTCSNWLSQCVPNEGEGYEVTLRRGTLNFELAMDASRAAIVVAPGTGIAGVRGFIQDRVHSKCKDTVLIFGCRGEKTDYFYREEWEKYENDDKLKVITAFSRDQGHKIYVQHRIKENSQMLFNLIHEKSAYIFVCGNSKTMPDQVRDAFIDVIDSHAASPIQGQTYIDDMVAKKRYQEETW